MTYNNVLQRCDAHVLVDSAAWLFCPRARDDEVVAADAASAAITMVQPRNMSVSPVQVDLQSHESRCKLRV